MNIGETYTVIENCKMGIRAYQRVMKLTQETKSCLFFTEDNHTFTVNKIDVIQGFTKIFNNKGEEIIIMQNLDRIIELVNKFGQEEKGIHEIMAELNYSESTAKARLTALRGMGKIPKLTRKDLSKKETLGTKETLDKLEIDKETEANAERIIETVKQNQCKPQIKTVKPPYEGDNPPKVQIPSYNLEVLNTTIKGLNGTYKLCKEGIELSNEETLLSFENEEEFKEFTAEFTQIFDRWSKEIKGGN